MSPVIFRTSDGFYCLDLRDATVIDGKNKYWYKDFIVDKFKEGLFKGLKKEHIMKFAMHMRIKTFVIGAKGKTKDNTISQVLDDISKQWDGFFQSDWEWESGSDDDDDIAIGPV